MHNGQLQRKCPPDRATPAAAASPVPAAASNCSPDGRCEAMGAKPA
jgi:hypothetical protein